jgi:hypothetical protein
LEKGTFDKEEMEKIQAEREGLPEYYKRHIELTFDGLERALLFLEEVSNTLFSHIE